MSSVKAMKLSVPEKYHLYVLEQEAKKIKTETGAGEAVDMASYAQFEKDFR